MWTGSGRGGGSKLLRRWTDAPPSFASPPVASASCGKSIPRGAGRSSERVRCWATRACAASPGPWRCSRTRVGRARDGGGFLGAGLYIQHVWEPVIVVTARAAPQAPPFEIEINRARGDQAMTYFMDSHDR